MPSRVLSCIFALAIALPAAAQEAGRISADSPDVDGTRIQPGEWTMRYIRKTGDTESETGAVRFDLARTTIHGEAGWRSVQRITTPRGTYADTAIFLARSLRPVMHRSRNAARVLSLTFDGARVTGSFTPAGGERQAVDHTMDVPGFDANILDLIFGALPLAEGYSGTVIAYVYEAGGAIEVPFRVTGTTTVDAEGGRREAWELAVTYPFGRGRFWVDRSSRQPLGAEIETTDGTITRVVR